MHTILSDVFVSVVYLSNKTETLERSRSDFGVRYDGGAGGERSGCSAFVVTLRPGERVGVGGWRGECFEIRRPGVTRGCGSVAGTVYRGVGDAAWGAGPARVWKLRRDGR